MEIPKRWRTEIKREKRGQAALASSRECELHNQLPTNRLSPVIPAHKQPTRLLVSTSLPHLSPNPREKQQLLVVYGHLEPCGCTLLTCHPRTTRCTLPTSSTGRGGDISSGNLELGWEEEQRCRGTGDCMMAAKFITLTFMGNVRGKVYFLRYCLFPR